jgi:ActR/RegA family two-component response regulator
VYSVARMIRGRWAIVPRLVIEVKPGVLKRSKDEIARAALAASDGNTTQAAALLGIHRQVLQRILKRPRKRRARRRSKAS